MLYSFCVSFKGPGDPVPKVRKALASYFHRYPQEKVYLQLDRQSYLSGETIWFSGYVICQSKPSTISNIVYTELFNEKGFVITRSMLRAQQGSLSGQFVLPEDLRTGNYYVRAYTAWMLNFPSSLFFYRKISVTGKGKTQKEKPGPGYSDFSVRFFPESGNLVSRLTSQVVFKAVDTNGLPVNISGKIFNNMGDTVALIKTVHDGMGSFVIHCSPQTTYTALVSANGMLKKIQLPVVQTSGIVLHTENHHNTGYDSIFFHISRSGINRKEFEHLILCAQMENHFSVTKIHFDESAVNDPMDTILTAPYPLLLNNFSNGLLRLTLLNDSGTIMAERLVFLHYGKSAPVQLLPGTDATKEKNSFIISLPDGYKGMLTVAVTAAGKEGGMPGDESIQSAMLLSSGVDASVHNPDWYFDDSNPESASALDALLVTCKPNSFDLQKILAATEPPVKYLPEKLIALKGHAFQINGETKASLANSTLFLILKAPHDSLTKPLSAETDSAGLFTVNELSFHDTAAIYVQTGIKTDGHTNNGLAILFDKTIFDSIAHNNFVIAPSVLNSKLSAGIADSLTNNTTGNYQPGLLKNVTVTAKAKSHLDSVLSQYASGIFASPGAWAQTLDLTNDEITKNSDQDILGWLNGKVAGLNYSYSNGKPIITWRSSNFMAGLSGVDQLKLNAPSFFLNEALLNTGLEGYDGAVDLLSGIRMADVALIRIFKPGTMPNVPENGPHGCIAIYLKNGRENNMPVSKINFEKSSVCGFSIPGSFSTVNSSSANNNTLYWNPSLYVDPVTHTASFSFNNNGNKQFMIVAEGMDENGILVRIKRLVQ